MQNLIKGLFVRIIVLITAVALLPVLCLTLSGCGEDAPDPGVVPGDPPVVLETPGNRIIPKPVEYRESETPRKYTLTAQSGIGYHCADVSQNEEVKNIADDLAGRLRASTGYDFPVAAVAGGGSGAIILKTVPKTEALSDEGYEVFGDEGYSLTVDSVGILVTAYAPEGLFRGIQTVRQMLPAEIEKTAAVENAEWNIEYATVNDYPRYEFRSIMIDVARHFFTKEELKRQIDIIAGFKMNTVHLHLSDDQGFRIAFDGYDMLTDFGGITKDLKQRTYTKTGVTDFPPGSPYYGNSGYYTKEDFLEIVAYAKERYVQIIPEIDLPSHNASLLLSIPSLCAGGDIPDEFLDLMYGSDVGYGMTLDPNAHSKTAEVLNDILDELVEMTDSDYIHIGGDEAHDMTDAQYDVVTKYLLDGVKSRGKKTMEWAASNSDRVDHPFPDVFQNWIRSDNPGAYAARAVAAGSKVVASFANRAYLDHYTSMDVPIGISWARKPGGKPGGIPLNVAYQWDPEDAVPAAYRDKGHVIGVECALFSETVGSEAALDMLLYPKVLGYAELGWSPKEDRYVGMEGNAAWSTGTPKTSEPWENYKSRLSAHGKRLSYRGITFLNYAELWEKVDIELPEHNYHAETAVNQSVSGRIAYAVEENARVEIKMLGHPTQGQCTVNVDGSWTYVPNRNFVGTDSFTVAFAVNDLGIPINIGCGTENNRLSNEFGGMVNVSIGVKNTGGVIEVNGVVDAIHNRNIVVRFDVPVPGLEKNDFSIANATVRFAKTYDNGSTYLLVTTERTKGTNYAMTVTDTGYRFGGISCVYR